MSEETISHNAGKVLLQIYLIWKEKHKVPNFNELLNITKLNEIDLKTSLDYCLDKSFIEANVVRPGGRRVFIIQKITSDGIDIIEKPAETPKEKRPFNLTFNFNTDFNIDSIIKGEAKLF